MNKLCIVDNMSDCYFIGELLNMEVTLHRENYMI